MNCIKIYTNYHNKIGDYMYVDYLIVLERTILFYIVITIIYRIMGKREVGQLGIIDLIVSVLIAELVAISLEDTTKSIFLVIIPIFLFIFSPFFLQLDYNIVILICQLLFYFFFVNFFTKRPGDTSTH